MFPAAGEKRNLLFSVSSVISVPLFNLDLATPAFATLTVNAHSSTHRPDMKNKTPKLHLWKRGSAARFPFFIEEVSEVPHAGLGQD